MPKSLLYGLAALANVIIAIVAFNSGRVLIPAVLILASIFFIVAAIGAARQSGQKAD